MAVPSLTDRYPTTPDVPLRLPGWAGSVFGFLPVPVLGGGAVLLHLGGLPVWQEALGQTAVVLIGFSIWALWARAQEAQQDL